MRAAAWVIATVSVVAAGAGPAAYLGTPMENAVIQDPSEEPVVSAPVPSEVAELAGYVVDEAQRPVEDALVTLDATSTTRTPGSGGFRFLDLSPGSHLLRAEHPSFATNETHVVLLGGSSVTTILTLTPIPITAPTPPPPPPAPHAHDLWEGRDRVDVIDGDFSWHEPYQGTGPVSDAHEAPFGYAVQPVSNSCVASPDHVYFNNRPFWFDDPRQLVWPGTTEIVLRPSWPATEVAVGEVAFAWKNATSTTYHQGPLIANGEEFRIPVDAAAWDPSHSPRTLWELWACVSDDDVGSGEEGRAFFGTIHIESTLVGGAPLPLEPAHVEPWNAISTSPIVSAQRSIDAPVMSSRSPSADNLFAVVPAAGAVILPNTTRLEVTLSWAYPEDALDTPAWSLSYRSADKTPAQTREPRALAREPAATFAEHNRTYSIPVAPAQTDGAYATNSTWLFFLNLEGQEDDWSWVNPCGCTIEVRLDVVAFGPERP